MAIKDISDEQVCQAVQDSNDMAFVRWPHDLLQERTGQPEKVCYGAMERAYRNGLIDYGVSFKTSWLTQAGESLIRVEQPSEAIS